MRAVYLLDEQRLSKQKAFGLFDKRPEIVCPLKTVPNKPNWLVSLQLFAKKYQTVCEQSPRTKLVFCFLNVRLLCTLRKIVNFVRVGTEHPPTSRNCRLQPSHHFVWHKFQKTIRILK